MKVQVEDTIKNIFRDKFGKEVDKLTPIAESGSPRKYFRIATGDKTYIGAYNPDLKENEAFLLFSKHFHQTGLPVPEIYAEDNSTGCYLLSDLGNDILFDRIKSRENKEQIPQDLYDLLSSTIKMLPHFQVRGGDGLDYSVCYPRASFDKQSMMWDLNYFKYYMLKTSGITFNEQLLENDFLRFAEFLLQAGQEHFMYRDFQSRNVLIQNRKPYFIDYQGGRKGPLQYDLASFLYQVKAYLPENTKKSLLDDYLNEAGKLMDISKNEFLKYFYPFVYMRMFQVLGAYGFRGLFEKRPHFTESLEPALASLADLIDRHPFELELTELKSVLRKLTHSSKYLPVHHNHSDLVVSVNSFSYKKGIPEDTSGHGGGFVYDCRILPNPGRLETYKELTGRDKAVIEYLERHREVDKFLHNIFEISDAAVENYIERGFTKLSISFGCTGGQHRSVYFADRLAEHLSGKYVITVKLNHREQKITETRKG